MENMFLQMLDKCTLFKKKAIVFEIYQNAERNKKNAHPNRVDHTLWDACCPWRVHYKERMIEGDLFKWQLLTAVTASDKLFQENTVTDLREFTQK